MRYYDTCDSRKNIFILLSGIMFGLALLTKVTGVLILLVLIIYAYQHLKNDRRKFIYGSHSFFKALKAIWDTTKVLIIGLLIFGTFIIIKSYFLPVTNISDEGLGQFSIVRLAKAYLFFPDGVNHFNLVLLLSQLALALFMMGPFYIFGVLASLKKWWISKDEDNNKKILLYLWIAVIFIFYLFGLRGYERSFERYLIAAMPAICILCADFISGLISEVMPKNREEKKGNIRTISKLSKKNTIKYLSILVMAFILGLILFFSLNFSHTNYISFYPKTAYFENVMKLHWDFFVPFTGNAGPLGFYIHFKIIIISFIMLFISLSAYFLTNSKRQAVMIVILSLGFLFAYNIFLIQEFSFSTTSLDIDMVSKEMVRYVNERYTTINLVVNSTVAQDIGEYNLNEKHNMFLFRNYAMQFYFNRGILEKYNIFVLDFENESSENASSKVLGGTVLIVDFPVINKKSTLWVALQEECYLSKTFEDKGQTVGYIFEC
jgi:hypothetical protein